jgi:hypothetical protein
LPQGPVTGKRLLRRLVGHRAFSRGACLRFERGSIRAWRCIVLNHFIPRQNAPTHWPLFSSQFLVGTA